MRQRIRENQIISLLVVDAALIVGVLTECVPLDFLSVSRARYDTWADYVLAIVAIIAAARMIIRLCGGWPRQPWAYFLAMILSVFAVVEYAVELRTIWLRIVFAGTSCVLVILAAACWRRIANLTGHEWWAKERN